MAKKLAVIFGIVFILVGLLGFFENPIIGSSGIFLTDGVHNVVHLLVGIILLIAAGMGNRASSMWLTIFGVVYIILFIDGLIEGDTLLGFVAQNSADTWLHLVLGIVLLGAGLMTKNESTVIMDSPTM